MKKLVLTMFAAALCCGAFAQVNQFTQRYQESERGRWGVGFSLNYGTGPDSWGIGLKADYGITDYLRISPNFTYFFPNDYLSMWDVNADLQYVVNAAPAFNVYPLLGLTVAGANFSPPVLGSWSTTKFGVNIGFGFEYMFAPSWSVDLDYKYKIVSDIDQSVVSLGFGYRF